MSRDIVGTGIGAHDLPRPPAVARADVVQRHRVRRHDPGIGAAVEQRGEHRLPVVQRQRREALRRRIRRSIAAARPSGVVSRRMVWIRSRAVTPKPSRPVSVMRAEGGTASQLESWISATITSVEIGMFSAPSAPMEAMLPSSEKISVPGRAKPRSVSTRWRSPLPGPKKFSMPCCAHQSRSVRCVSWWCEPIAAEVEWSITITALSGRGMRSTPMRSRLRLWPGQNSSWQAT